MDNLSKHYSFKNYASREDYEAQTGKIAAPWNPNRKLKYWADENPTNTEFDENRGEEATYRPVLSVQDNGRYREGADGQPLLGKITLPIDEAKSYNFPPRLGIFPVVGEILPYGTETNDAFGTPIPKSTKVTAAHVANSQKTIQSPLNLPEGSRVVYAPGLGGNAAVLLKGETLPGAPTASPGCKFAEPGPVLIHKTSVNEIAAAVANILRSEGFPKP